MQSLTVYPARTIQGTTRIPGDKSISHRALLLGALADGESQITGFLPSGDCTATLGCLQALGIHIDRPLLTTAIVQGQGLTGLRPAIAPLNCVRSGTTIRLLAGLLAGQTFDSILNGDPQLLRRPMRRVVDPLRRMGAEITDTEGCAPLQIRGRSLQGMEHTLEIASAQVKSALLLAGLYADGPVTVHQPGPARDHTERMMQAMGAELSIADNTVTIAPGAKLAPLTIQIPGDISSAAFPLIAAILLPQSNITLIGVGVNPTRTGLLNVLQSMGADITVTPTAAQGGEPVANLTPRFAELSGIEIGGSTVVRMIDEFPILAVAATQARGLTRVRNAAELRVKETDRIATVVTELQKLGATIEAHPDGFSIEGPRPLQGGEVDSHGDHRLAMALVIAGLIAQQPVTVRGIECIADSFPGFVPLMQALGAPISVSES